MKPRMLGWLCLFTGLFLVGFQCRSQETLQHLNSHVRPAVARGQARALHAMEAGQRLNLSIVLPLRNPERLKTLLSNLYDPSSPEYRHFLSVAEFTQQFGPTEEDYQRVVDFAKANGFEVTGYSANRLVVPIRGSVAQAQRAFHVAMKVYQHPTEDRTFFSPDREPSIALAVPIAQIAGLDDFSIPHSMAIKGPAERTLVSNAVQGSGPGGSYLGSDMRSAYYGGSTLTGAGQTVGLVQFDGYFQSDVDLTFSNAGQAYSVPIVNVLLDGVDGTPAATGDDAEQVIDIVQAIGMAPGLSQVRVYIGRFDVDIFNAVATENLAKQVSISWSWQPNDTTVDDEFFKEMAAQGQSVFAASGDDGAFDPSHPYYFPAEDDWVTATGGTVLQTQGAGGPWQSEAAWQRSGGGISPDLVPLPSWQRGLSNPSNNASSAYRNVPDVAMEADFDSYACDMGACTGSWAGTSFAAPRWAGFMALVNEQAAAAKDQATGFLNPAVYSFGTSAGNTLHDVTSGNNQFAQGHSAWFNAVPGYDLVTGWGSPAGQPFIDELAPWTQAGFQLSLSSTSVLVSPGSSGALTVTVAGHLGYNGSVNLAVTGMPAGVTASWSENPTAGSSVLTLSVGTNAPRGQYRLTVTGTDGNLTSSTAFTLLVNAAGFSITALPMNFAVYPGNPGVSGSATFTVNAFGGFAGPVSFALATPLPQGLSATWTTDSAGIPMLTLSAGTSAEKGVVDLTVVGTSGSLSATTEIEVYVYSPLFVINVMPPPGTLIQGSSVTATVSAIPLGTYDGTIDLSSPNLPAGLSAAFAPASIDSTQSSQLTLSATPTATLGSDQVMIVGSGPGATAFYLLPLDVVAAQAPGFTLSAAAPSLVVQQGGNASTTLTVNPIDGFNDPVRLMGMDFAGEMSSFSSNPTTGSSVWTVSVSNSVPTGAYWLQYAGSSGNLSAKGVVLLIVNPAALFTLAVTSDTISIAPGGSASSTITVTPSSGFSGTVDLAIGSKLPEGISATITPGGTATTSALQIAVAGNVAPGQYFFNVTGISGTQTVVATVYVHVTALPPQSAATPIFSLPSGTYASGQTVTISDSTAGAELYYSTDGSTPTAGSTPYSGPITVSATETIEAIATAVGYSPSAVATATYTITPPAGKAPTLTSIAPAFTDAGGPAFTMMLTGSGFTSSSTAYWGSGALATQYVSASQLTAQVPSASVATSGESAISVHTPDAGGSTSNALQFEVDSAPASTSAPSFTTTTATVVAGSTATYPVTLSSSATSISATCLNLPAGATCSYSSATGALSIATQPSTPVGVYQVTVVFAETITGASNAWLFFPLLLAPLPAIRRRRADRKKWFAVLLLLGVALIGSASGCGGSPGGGLTVTPAPTHQITSSGVVSMTVR